MNKLARAVLTLYSYDDDPDDLSLENNMRQSISLIARMPAIMTYAYQVKRRHFDKKDDVLSPVRARAQHGRGDFERAVEDRRFTREEAELLDLVHGAACGARRRQQPTFTARVLSSAHTDIYSTIAAAIGSLKGFRHGGANHKVCQMMADIMRNVQHWDSDDEVEAYLERILRREAGDKSGLIYGVGHAIYTLSDPRAVELKKQAKKLAAEKGYGDQFALYERIERLAPAAFKKR